MLITGSGFYDLETLRDTRIITAETPFGDVPITTGRWNGEHPVLFLARHGTDHSIAPHLINYRANIWAARDLGASAIIATAVSGGIAPDFAPGDFVIIDDFIDFTDGRHRTFFDSPGELQHTDMSMPFDPDLRQLVTTAAASVALPLHQSGTYCATNGPRFESRAEIEMMRRMGGDLVGMTGCPEVILANELELPYASIGVISNRAAGLGDRELSVPEIMQVIGDAAGPLESLLGATIELHAT